MTWNTDKLRSWYETEMPGNRILAMEGLRGLAIALVFICHFQIVILERLSSSFHSKFYLTVAEIGGTGVDLFFLLSGMLIYRAAMKPNLHYGKFLLLRIQRIYPTFIVVLTLYLVLSVFLHIGEHYRAVGFQAQTIYLLENVFLLPGVLDVPPIIAAAWSLSYEFSFYLAIPILVRVLALRKWRAENRMIFWAVIIAAYLAFAMTAPNLLPHYRYADGSFVRFTLFLAGMILEEVLVSPRAHWFVGHKVQSFLLLSGGAAAAVLFAAEWHAVGTALHRQTNFSAARAFFVLVLYSALALTALHPAGLLRGLFSRSALRWTGNISYSFYLIHGFTLNVLAVLAAHLVWAKHHPQMAVPMLFVAASVGTFATATALYLLVERPYSLNPRSKGHVSTADVPTAAMAREPQQV